MKFCTVADALSALRDSDALWLDARSPDEFSLGHVPGALSCPWDSQSTWLPVVLERQPKVWMVYCAYGQSRCLRVARLLMEALPVEDRSRIWILEGGFEAWKRAGVQIQRRQRRWFSTGAVLTLVLLFLMGLGFYLRGQ